MDFRTRDQINGALQGVLDQAHSSLFNQIVNGAAETTIRVEVSRPSYPAKTTRISVTQIISIADVEDES